MLRFNSINDILNHRLKIKKDRSEIRFEEIDNLEKPRDVYLKTCLTIANYFLEYGFRYSKSALELVKETDDKALKIKIRFQSDYNNIRGVFVGLTIGVSIESPSLKKWQKQYGIPGQIPWGRIYGGDLSKFGQNKTMLMQWNLADDNEREIAIIEVVDMIENNVLPIFELFKDIDLICSMIIDGNFISYDPLINIQYLLLNKSKIETCTAIRNYLNKDKSIMDNYLLDNEKIIKEGMPPKMASYSHNIAYFTNFYNLKNIFS